MSKEKITKVVGDCDCESSGIQFKLRPVLWCLEVGQTLLAAVGVLQPSTAKSITSLSSATYRRGLRLLATSDNGIASYLKKAVTVMICLWLCRIFVVSIIWRLCWLFISLILRATPLGIVSQLIFS
jgi:preprotein translocase subunit SecG